jgi:CRISPR/Cas system-associated protein Csm6
MSGDYAKREIVTGDMVIGSRRTVSKESGDKYKEESSSYIKSHRKGDKKKNKMKKVVYYETDSSSPSTSGTSVRSIVRCLFTILTFQSVLLYFRYP